jgi:AcrR family transcriptional regulator
MRQTPERRQQVLDTAQQLIASQGVAGFSMLALAQVLGMSKETLYAWFGNKAALLEELVRGNAREATSVLSVALARPAQDRAALERVLADFCRRLLGLLMSERSLVLNRSAIHAGPAEGFGQTLRSQGRDAALAQLRAVLDQAVAAGLLRPEPGQTMAEVLIALNLRDWQLERLLGRMDEPSTAAQKKRAAEAARLFMQLYAA